MQKLGGDTHCQGGSNVLRMDAMSSPSKTGASGAHARINPADLLETLRRLPALAPFRLGACCEQEMLFAPGGSPYQFCEALGKNTLCDQGCRRTFATAFTDVCAANHALSFTCPAGLIHFAVPFRNHLQQSCCVFAGGCRDASQDMNLLERLANATGANGADLLERLEKIPQITPEQLEDAVAKTTALLPALVDDPLMALPLQKMTQRITAITAIAAEIDRTASLDETIHLLGESLILLYDLPKVAVILGEGDELSVKAALGMASRPLAISSRKIADFLSGNPKGKATLLHQEVAAFFPEADVERAVCAPLTNEGKSLGMVVLFDVELQARDLLLIELLMGRVAGKLLRLKTAAEQQAQQNTTQQLITMISELSLFANRETLYQGIVAMSCELLQASRGSLMLVDDSDEQLHIVAAKGINLEVARNLPIRLGEGISGRVARSGLFLLVSDIEKDCRIATTNRPRFKTKSFISFPMKTNNRIVGVLNLADKENGHIFTDTDLKHLHLLAGHAAQMIDRTAALEEAHKLEELAARDPLTGLYNRRLLEARFHEELNRCSRAQQALTILMVDLDYFKTYNDLCGHIAGDHALRKVAEILKNSGREMDIVTRYGGEEFCLLLPNTGREEALFVAERIRRAIENQRFPGETGMPQKKLTASIGISAFPNDGKTFETLINAADVALYQAKSKGRNRLATFEPIFLTRGKQAI